MPMIWPYYSLFSLGLVAAAPFMLWREKARAGLAQKLGSVPARVRQTAASKPNRIWFHAVSVGEFNATLPLLEAFRQKHPHYSVFVSTATATAQRLAQDKVGDWATVFYFPFDLPWAVQSWLDAIQPQVAVIAETELWPGFTYECRQRGIKLCIVNGRISPRSFKRYRRIGSFFSRVLGRFDAIAAQSDQEAERYRALGAREEAVYACGNMKFDGIKALSTEGQARLREQVGLRDEFVIVGGSTHEGEETALLNALNAHPDNTRLIIAPRHPERFQRVCDLVEANGCRARRYSSGDRFERPNDVYVIDTIGQLMAFYSLGSVAFVGGTIAPIGGHSLIEPFAYSIPVLCGPHTEKTRDVARSLLERDALVQVQSPEELAKEIIRLAANPAERLRLGAAGRTYLSDSQGAVNRTLSVLESVMTDETRSARLIPTMENGPMENGPMENGPIGNGPMENGAIGNGPMGNGAIGNGPMGNGAIGNGAIGNAAIGSSK
jgi:3-deoxy-D-manno-octulosonic-acid transferase